MERETDRLRENDSEAAPWHRWGPYLSERQWGTVREDYSADGNAWESFTHDQARSRAYRWGEDGIGGFGDRHGYLAFAWAFWNGRDPILKERLFGLTNREGNHGEDVKELYWYLDATPTHSYQKMRYRYPIAAYPYAELVERNRDRGPNEPEFELLDTNAFEEGWFEIDIVWAKAGPEDILGTCTVTNRSDQAADLWVLPQAWARNRWSWYGREPQISLHEVDGGVEVHTDRYGTRHLYVESADELLFTGNETNREAVFGVPNESLYVKDAFHRYLIHGEAEAIDPSRKGTKFGGLRRLRLVAGESLTIRIRFSPDEVSEPFGDAFDGVISDRYEEANEFYRDVASASDPEVMKLQREAFAGLLWSKQFYHYDVARWAQGDAEPPKPPEGHGQRNEGWPYFRASEVISMPDKWEYPWFAAWDLAFHTIPFTLIDPKFAKEQLLLLMREWYMHPNGQIPAYEWAFSDTNPPVHAWAALRVYQIENRLTGRADADFLKRAFHKLLLNFTWWINRKDAEGNNLFEGGFLGLDNIGVFDRNMMLLDGVKLEQSDGTSWVAMFCLNMMSIAIELTKTDPSYEDVASKFFEHFVEIGIAMHKSEMWDEEDGFYYDVLVCPQGTRTRIPVRSAVGLIPLFAVGTIEQEDLDRMPGFRRRMDWYLQHSPDAMSSVAPLEAMASNRRSLCLVGANRLARILGHALDEGEFLSDYGIRSLSRHFREHPYHLTLQGGMHSISYEPAESTAGLFGGNSNWRGPIWFPINFLILESLQKHHHYLGDQYLVAFPTGSDRVINLWELSQELSKRLISIFLPDAEGKRPVHGASTDVDLQAHPLFYEYFHGDTGAGLGASHQTGWTALVAKMVDQVNLSR